jgi:hypothetical protein
MILPANSDFALEQAAAKDAAAKKAAVTIVLIQFLKLGR